jgi:hypothetical protein
MSPGCAGWPGRSRRPPDEDGVPCPALPWEEAGVCWEGWGSWPFPPGGEGWGALPRAMDVGVSYQEEREAGPDAAAVHGCRGQLCGRWRPWRGDRARRVSVHRSGGRGALLVKAIACGARARSLLAAPAALRLTGDAHGTVGMTRLTEAQASVRAGTVGLGRDTPVISTVPCASPRCVSRDKGESDGFLRTTAPPLHRRGPSAAGQQRWVRVG